MTLTALPARSVAARAPGAASSLRARCAASAAHSARLRLETAATGHDIAWTLDMLAVTLDSIAARHPDRADRLAARSESARALAARIRQQFPVSRHAAVPAGRSRPPAPQPDAVPASPARRVTPRPGLAAPRGAAPDLPAPVPG